MKRWLGVVGNVLDHYDRALYAFLAPFLAPLFFPHADPVYSLLASYALLPLGAVARFLGAIFFSWLGDSVSYRTLLSMTLIGMAVATGAMGFLPTWHEAGWISPVLLGLCRIAQNFFAAGKQAAGLLFVLEGIDAKRWGWIGSLFDACGIVGILAASGAALLCGQEHWRGLFLLGSLSGVVGMCLHDRHAVVARTQMPSRWERRDIGSIFSIACVSAFSHANYDVLSTFLNGYLPLVSDVNAHDALSCNTVLLALDVCLLPIIGYMTLRVAKEYLMFTALLFSLVFTIPLFSLLEGGSLWVASAVRISMMIFGVILAAPFYSWAIQLARPERRLWIYSLGSSFGGRLLAAPATVMGFWLYRKTGWVASPALLIVFYAGLAFSSVLFQFVKQNQRLERSKSV